MDGVGSDYIDHITRGGVVPDVEAITLLEDKFVALDYLECRTGGNAHSIEDISRGGGVDNFGIYLNGAQGLVGDCQRGNKGEVPLCLGERIGGGRNCDKTVCLGVLHIGRGAEGIGGNI